MVDPFDALVTCGRAAAAKRAGAGAGAERTQLAHVTDWATVLRAAADHGLVSLCTDVALSVVRDLLSPDAVERLTMARRESVARALAAAAQVADVQRAFGRASVESLPYKGPALSVDAYGDVARRDSDDIDVVVVPGDADRAAQVLAAEGYNPAGGLSWREARRLNDWQGHVTFGHEKPALPVELHWRFCNRTLPWTLPVRDVMKRSRFRDVAGVSMRIPDRADQLVLVLLHAARHGWDRLESITCAGALLATDVDVEALVERARSAGGLRACLVGAVVTHRLLGVPLPAPIGAAATRDRSIERLAAEAIERLRAGNAGLTRDLRLQMALQDGVIGRARFAGRVLFLPQADDLAAVPLAGPLSIFYPAVRVIRVAGRALAS